jgi:hypothetical protein
LRGNWDDFADWNVARRPGLVCRRAKRQECGEKLPLKEALCGRDEGQQPAMSGQIEARKNSPRMAGSGVLPTLADAVPDFE